MEETKIGKITHFFDKISVGVIAIEDNNLKVGDTIHIKGATTDFEQGIDSMQIDHESVEVAESGKSIGLKLKDKAREHDIVYKMLE